MKSGSRSPRIVLTQNWCESTFSRSPEILRSTRK
jgi:hypothetical protein